ncbi:MAG: hypothetical protein LBG06_08190 [Deltaproteobacteria bacterium]|nr:hypothetical protein [Deltaproteobacteria bacterium]
MSDQELGTAGQEGGGREQEADLGGGGHGGGLHARLDRLEARLDRIEARMDARMDRLATKEEMRSLERSLSDAREILTAENRSLARRLDEKIASDRWVFGLVLGLLIALLVKSFVS